MIEKRWLAFLCFTLVATVSLTIVSAWSVYDIDLRQGAEDLSGMIDDTFSPLFEVLLATSSGEYFFAKVLLFLLLMIIVYTVLKRLPLFDDTPIVALIVSFVFSVLAVRYMPEGNFISYILLPYTAAGTAIAVFIPYLIYLFFVHQSVPGTHARRAAWVVFGIVYIILWFFRTTNREVEEIMNIAGLAAIGIAFIWDKNIHAVFERVHIARAIEGVDDQIKSDALDNYRTAAERYNIDPSNFNKRLKNRAKRKLVKLGVSVPR